MAPPRMQLYIDYSANSYGIYLKYIAKIALDITAKHVPDHIGILDEESYCKSLWNHKPLTDFWRIGPGIAKQLKRFGLFTMGRCERVLRRFWRFVDSVKEMSKYQTK